MCLNFIAKLATNKICKIVHFAEKGVKKTKKHFYFRYLYIDLS